MLVRRIARPLLAAAFVAEGVDAVRRPDEHVDRAQTAWAAARARVDLPEVDRDRLRLAVRAHGAITALAGLSLALGRAPRSAALLLAALTAPLAVADGLVVASDVRRSGPTRRRLWRDLSMVGATLLAGIDTEARPGLVWRAGHARVDRAVSRGAHDAVAAARKEVRAAHKAVQRG